MPPTPDEGTGGSVGLLSIKTTSVGLPLRLPVKTSGNPSSRVVWNVHRAFFASCVIANAKPGKLRRYVSRLLSCIEVVHRKASPGFRLTSAAEAALLPPSLPPRLDKAGTMKGFIAFVAEKCEILRPYNRRANVITTSRPRPYVPRRFTRRERARR